MHAIEFIAESEEGSIKIPKKYQAQLRNKFRVIILQDELPTETKSLPKKRVLNAISYTTNDLKFDRDEANER